MRLRLLLLAVLLTVSGIAAAQEPIDPPPNALAGVTISCSLAAPSWVAGCFVEAPPAVLGPFSVGLGVDGQVDVDQLLAGDLSGSHLAPYLVVVWSLDRGAMWAELALPSELLGVPIVGRPDWARVGRSWTVPP